MKKYWSQKETEKNLKTNDSSTTYVVENCFSKGSVIGLYKEREAEEWKK